MRKNRREKSAVTRGGDHLPNKYREQYKHRVQKDISKTRLPREAACQECLNKCTLGERKRKERKDMLIILLDAHKEKKKMMTLRNMM